MKKIYILLEILSVIAFIIFLSYGKTYLMDQLWFKILWKFVWFILLPVILFLSIRELNKKQKETDEKR
jgi:uncharacterized membrane protein